MKRFFGVAVAALVLVSAVSAYSAQDIVGSAHFETLKKEGKIQNNKFKGANTAYTLMPSTELSRKIVSSEKNDIAEPSLVGENLYLIPRDKISINRASEILRSISKMQGMKYYSTSKKKEMVLYEKAYMIADENSKEPIPDKNTGNADGQISYSYQDDNSFGPNRYKLCYFQNENQLLAQFNLVDVMGLGPFKAIYPGKFINNILVIDCGEDFLLYLCTDLDSVKFPGIKGQIVDSMTSRMDAIYKWFITQF